MRVGSLTICDVESCVQPAITEDDGVHIVRCALHEIASYNADELREWGEENAADMVDIARKALARKVVA